MIGKAVGQVLLQKGFKVIGTDNAPAPYENENFTYVRCDITDKELITGIFSKNKVDVLVHLACTADNDFGAVFSSAEEKKSAAVDKYLYKAAEASRIGDIIMLSTYQVYAPQKTREPIRETMEEKPLSIYAKLKYDSERALANALKKSSTKGIVMRVCPIYTKEFVDNLKAKVFDEKEGCGYVYGYGDYGYTFTCLYNIADFVYGILTCSEGITYQGIYNVCDTKPIAAKDIVEFLRNERKIGAVLSRDYGSAAIKNANILFGTKAQKTDYRYNDVSTACSNISYDNTKAQRISTFRWKLSNTK